MRPIIRTWKPFGDPCGRCHGPNDPYMVTFELWGKIIPKEERGGFLCLECLEKALGRSLQFDDFIHEGLRDPDGKLTKFWGGKLPINYGYFGFSVTEFLASRRESE